MDEPPSARPTALSAFSARLASVEFAPSPDAVVQNSARMLYEVTVELGRIGCERRDNGSVSRSPVIQGSALGDTKSEPVRPA